MRHFISEVALAFNILHNNYSVIYVLGICLKTLPPTVDCNRQCLARIVCVNRHVTGKDHIHIQCKRPHTHIA